jgi:hypothetical protein
MIPPTSSMARHPDDIDPESRNRLPVVRRDALDDAVKAVYDEVATPSATSVAGLQGPGGIMLHSPTLVAAHRAYNRALRTVPDLPPALKELAILVAARAMDQPFEWTTHEGPAQALEQRRVHSATYAAAERLFGRRALVSLTALMASYTGAAVLLTVFDQQLPPDLPSTLPN